MHKTAWRTQFYQKMGALYPGHRADEEALEAKGDLNPLTPS